MASRSRAHLQRPDAPAGLRYMEVTREQVQLLDEQVRLVVRYQMDHLTADKPLREQFQELARNCYLQGVLDGAQFQAGRVPRWCDDEVLYGLA